MTETGRKARAVIVGLFSMGLAACDGGGTSATSDHDVSVTGLEARAGTARGREANASHGRDAQNNGCGGAGASSGRGGGSGGREPPVGTGGRGAPGGGMGGQILPPPPPPPPPSCPIFIPTTALITGSHQTVAAPSSSFAYAAAPELTAPSVTALYSSDLTWQALDVRANPGTPADPLNSFVGFGVPVFGCVDARAYTGIRFTVLGDLGTCGLNFAIVARNNNSVLFGGACTASACFGPSSTPLSVGTSTVHFSDLMNGSPNPTLDASAINDIQWNVMPPVDGVTAPCQAHFFVTDISFVAD